MRCESTFLFRVPGVKPDLLQCEKNAGHLHNHQYVRVWWNNDQEEK